MEQSTSRSNLSYDEVYFNEILICSLIAKNFASKFKGYTGGAHVLDICCTIFALRKKVNYGITRCGENAIALNHRTSAISFFFFTFPPQTLSMGRLIVQPYIPLILRLTNAPAYQRMTDEKYMSLQAREMEKRASRINYSRHSSRARQFPDVQFYNPATRDERG